MKVIEIGSWIMNKSESLLWWRLKLSYWKRLNKAKSLPNQKQSKKLGSEHTLMFIFHMGGPRPSWIDKILLHHLCIVCVPSHFWPFTKAKLIWENFNKNLDCWAKCPSFSGKKNFWGLPLSMIKDWYHQVFYMYF